MCHVEAEQDLSRLKKKNGLPGAKDHFKCVSISYNDVFLRENELHLGIFEKKWLFNARLVKNIDVRRTWRAPFLFNARLATCGVDLRRTVTAHVTLWTAHEIHGFVP